jgi:hypothetical protein
MRRQNKVGRRVPGANSQRQISLSASWRRIDWRQVDGRQGAHREKAATKHGIYGSTFTETEIAMLPALKASIGKVDAEILFVKA